MLDVLLSISGSYFIPSPKAKPHPGPGKNITVEQLEEFKTMILQGALVHGFPSNNWTCARAAALLETTFGLVYTADHVGVMMKELGLSPQKPDRRNMKRDETKIQLWERETLPDLKKSLRKAGQ